MQLVFHLFPMAKAFQSSVTSVARRLCFLVPRGHLLCDAKDVTTAVSQKTVLCPAFCYAGSINWQDEALLFSFESLAGNLILIYVCMR